MIIRKNKDNNRYIAYQYIKMTNGKFGMVYFEGLTFSEAINKAIDYLIK